MNNDCKSNNTVKELNQQIKQHLEELAQETDKARRTESMLLYLDSVAKFHHYSSSNIWLILLAKSDATHVAGFHAWKKLGRYVKRGEKGIPILAPHFWKEEDRRGNEIEQIGFHVAHVFDISQTDGEPLPEQPNWKSLEKNLELQEKLIEFAIFNGITVTIEALSGETQGVSMGGRIILSPDAGTKTMIHEIAHELLHQDENNLLSRIEKEMEAEAVGYVVSKHFRIDELASANYLSLYEVSSEEILTSNKRILQCASNMIRYVYQRGY